MPANPSAVPPSRREVATYELSCGCFLRRLPDGAVDQLTCAEHHAKQLVALSTAGAPAAVPDPEQ
jgi:hypothetical protein